MSTFISQSCPIFLDQEVARELNEHRGGTSDVYLTVLDGRRVLVKKLRKEFVDNEFYRNLYHKEYELGHELSHPNLVVYRSYLESSEGPMIALDYIDGLTLAEILESESQYFLKKSNLAKMVNQLLSCLDYMHTHQVVHLDLKPGNIMITQLNADVKVLDPGFCYSDTFHSTPGCDPEFAAPEQLDKSRYHEVGTCSDIYAVGRLLQEIEKAAGKKLPRPYHRLMERCLEDEVAKRPESAAAALKMVTPSKIIVKVLMAIIAVIVAASACLLVYEPSRKAIYYAIASMERFDMIDLTGVQYRVLSQDEGTCEVVNWMPAILDNTENHSAIISPVVEIQGKSYRVVSIKERAIFKNKYLRSVYIPEGVESIGEDAFSRCPLLSSVHLPKSIKKLGVSSFLSCNNLTSVVLSPSMKEIPVNAFTDCCLINIEIPEGVEVLYKDCFAKNHSLKSVKLPSTLKKIDRGVFFQCDSLKEIVIPEGVSEMGDYVFLRCPSFTDIYNYALIPQDANELFDSPQVRVHVRKEALAAYKSHPTWGGQVLVPDL